MKTMNPKMMSRDAMNRLFFHIIDGFKSSYEGILQLEENKVLSDEEIAELIKKNSERLIDRINEFKIHEKIFGIVFAILLGYMQITGEDLEMRRSARRTGRRKHESEHNILTI